MNDEIFFKELGLTDLHDDMLQDFTRYQETLRAWVPDSQGAVLKDTFFIDEWDAEKKVRVVQHFSQCIKNGGNVIAAFSSGKLIGFSCVEGTAFGTDGQYRELTYCHVSQEWRGLGIGKKLFAHICQAARRQGAGKLYLGAHPAEETQAFYKAVGCVSAQEINPEILAREPYDIQLELNLSL